jgi:HAD superfamily hydrolase (TIGR01662 family)
MDMDTKTVHMVIGYPASGKSGWSKKQFPDATYLNRDTVGGKVSSLIPHMIAAISDNKGDIVLDNLFPTVESRKEFIEHAKLRNIEVVCHWMQTSIEDSSINALTRMWDRYGQVFLGRDDIKAHPEAKKDPNMFPIVVLFKYRKMFEKPTMEEGFASIEKIPFVRRKRSGYDNKAVFFDYDDTLRTTTSEFKYPTKPDEVFLKDGVKEKMVELKKDGYLLLGVSNQSGVSKGILSNEDADACFDRTNELAGADIEYCYCPHSVPPSCYCRKPQSGIGVYFIEKYKLNPNECIMVGDQTSDKTFAKRLGMKFVHADEFFGE